MKFLSRLFVFWYRVFDRTKSKCFSLLISGAFGGFGKRTVLTPPLRFSGENRIEIGSGVFAGSGCWFQVLPDGANRSTAIWIGRGTRMSGACVISAVRHVSLGEDVLLARNVYISDHIHDYTRTHLPVHAQGIAKVRPVSIGRGAWLGQNVVVCPGVTIGRNSVIGANSVVNVDIPDFAVAVGAPARVVRQLPETIDD
jgi:acetyltransferase-like isoleucine patch superfamily enzyme